MFDSLLKSNQIYFRLVRRLVFRLVRRLVTRFLYFRPPLLRSGCFLGFGPIHSPLPPHLEPKPANRQSILSIHGLDCSPSSIIYNGG